MASIYERSQATASKLLARFKQGEISYVEVSTVGDAWNPTNVDTTYSMDAVASGVAQNYVDNSAILATDLMVTCAVFDAEPNINGRLVIDGKTLQIIKVIKSPAAGTVIAWKIICRG